jgi:hypothetical protein
MMVRDFPLFAPPALNDETLSEFAEFTSAQERIALGKKGRKAEATKKREEMENLIADTYGTSFHCVDPVNLGLGWKMMRKRKNGSRSKYGEQVSLTTPLKPRYLYPRYTSHPQVREIRKGKYYTI